MKKLLMLFCAGALISVLFAGCNEFKQERQQPPQTEDGAEINPIPVNEVSDEVVAFFEEYLAFSIDNPDPGFYFGDIDRHEQVCLTVNNVDEFKAVVPSATELPAIDFDKFTLVVGRYYISYGGWIIKEQSVDSEPDVMKLNLVLEDTGKGLGAVFYPSYWGLYPKLPQKPIAFSYSYIPYKE